MVIAARQVKNLMRLCFLIERKYAPYSKWFGTAFSKLNCAPELSPIFRDVLLSLTWKEREMHLARAFRVVARMHNALRITRPIAEEVSNYFGRPYLVLRRLIWLQTLLRVLPMKKLRLLNMGLVR